jgi:hypothetical protein
MAIDDIGSEIGVLSTILSGNADSTTGAQVSIPVFSEDSIDNWRMEQNISQGYYLALGELYRAGVGEYGVIPLPERVLQMGGLRIV